MSFPLRILMLEDRPEDAELMLRELRRFGYDPSYERVETLPEFLARVPAGFEVVLADHALPHFDSLTALRLLRAQSIDIPLLVVSGAVSDEEAVELLKHGAADYLLKDRLSRLGPAVAAALEQKRLQDENRRLKESITASEKKLRTIFGGEVWTDQEDRSAYRPEHEFVDGDRFRNYKSVSQALKKNPWIRRRRPLDQLGRPRQNRRLIHAGDWQKFLAQLRHSADPLDRPANMVDAVMELQKSIAREKERRGTRSH